MPGGFLQTAREIFAAGGWVMWPLLALSVISVAVICERLIFWMMVDRPGRIRWLADLADELRRGDVAAARSALAADGSPYARVVRTLLRRGVSEPAAMEAIEQHRGPLERFSALLSTVITAAPLLGILGTVTGIIQSFRLLGAASDPSGLPVSDPALVATGIAEALVTTAFGLIVAMVVLFPYVLFRAWADRALGRLESLAAAAVHGAAHQTPGQSPGPNPSPNPSQSAGGEGGAPAIAKTRAD